MAPPLSVKVTLHGKIEILLQNVQINTLKHHLRSEWVLGIKFLSNGKLTIWSPRARGKAQQLPNLEGITAGVASVPVVIPE